MVMQRECFPLGMLAAVFYCVLECGTYSFLQACRPCKEIHSKVNIDLIVWHHSNWMHKPVQILYLCNIYYRVFMELHLIYRNIPRGWSRSCWCDQVRALTGLIFTAALTKPKTDKPGSSSSPTLVKPRHKDTTFGNEVYEQEHGSPGTKLWLINIRKLSDLKYNLSLSLHKNWFFNWT